MCRCSLRNIFSPIVLVQQLGVTPLADILQHLVHAMFTYSVLQSNLAVVSLVPTFGPGAAT